VVKFENFGPQNLNGPNFQVQRDLR